MITHIIYCAVLYYIIRYLTPPPQKSIEQTDKRVSNFLIFPFNVKQTEGGGEKRKTTWRPKTNKPTKTEVKPGESGSWILAQSSPRLADLRVGWRCVGEGYCCSRTCWSLSAVRKMGCVNMKSSSRVSAQTQAQRGQMYGANLNAPPMVFCPRFLRFLLDNNTQTLKQAHDSEYI